MKIFCGRLKAFFVWKADIRRRVRVAAN